MTQYQPLRPLRPADHNTPLPPSSSLYSQQPSQLEPWRRPGASAGGGAQNGGGAAAKGKAKGKGGDKAAGADKKAATRSVPLPPALPGFRVANTHHMDRDAMKEYHYPNNM